MPDDATAALAAALDDDLTDAAATVARLAAAGYRITNEPPLNAVEDLDVARDALLEIHVVEQRTRRSPVGADTVENVCQHDGQQWPCDTAIILAALNGEHDR